MRACLARASLRRTSPTENISDVKPVTEFPGLTPTLPVTRVEPVFVTEEYPSTTKLAAEPSAGAVADCTSVGDPAASNTAAPNVAKILPDGMSQFSVLWVVPIEE